MKIVRLQSENIKKLRAVDITPRDNLVKITGKNAQGKSSVLDSILYALAGKKAIPTKPIRDGEERGEIELDLGEFVVKRTFTEAGTYLKVTTKDGAEYSKGQDKLSGLVKNISFDPLEFANKNGKEQVEVLTELLGIGEELEKLDEEYKALYEDRRVSGRRLKDFESQAKMDKPEDKYFGMEVVDVAVVSANLEIEREKHREIVEKKNAVSKTEHEIRRLQEELKIAEQTLVTYQDDLKRMETKFDVEVGTALRDQLESATEINARIAEARQYEDKQKLLQEAKKEADSFEKKIKSTMQSRENLIRSARMPIEGLGISEDGQVTYNDIPFGQLSGAERLKVSLSIAMAMNPELRVITIYDGSLLDEDNLRVIEDMAKDNDYQVWLEIVDSTGEIGFFIEDGEIRKSK